ncbi:MAG: permease, partial [Synergistaceae bacterium]|nr:permease [Synergistaceae bacterium]
MIWVLYGTALFLLAASALFDRGKTKKALKKGWNSFVNILPPFFAVLLLVS